GHRVEHRLAVRANHRLPRLVEPRGHALEPARQTHAGAAREHRMPDRRQLTIPEDLAEFLQKSNLRPDPARREIALEPDHRPARRIERVVARVAPRRRRKNRQANLWEQAIDVELLARIDLLVEQLGVVERVGTRERPAVPQTPGPHDLDTAPAEVE